MYLDSFGIVVLPFGIFLATQAPIETTTSLPTLVACIIFAPGPMRVRDPIKLDPPIKTCPDIIENSDMVTL
jgi:hypothetical protein